MSGTRQIVIALLLLSSAFLLLGALVLPWWTGVFDQGSFRVDTREMEMCLRGLCGKTKALSVMGQEAHIWSRVGASVFAASLVASITLVLSALQGFRNRVSGSIVHWLAGSLAFFCGLLGILFIWLRPDEGSWTASYGMASTLAGASMGAIAASVASRLHRA